MRYLKITAVIFGALVITALGIDAADSLEGKSGTMLGQLLGSQMESLCPSGMVHIATGQTFSCVDVYEAAPSGDCPVAQPGNPVDTKTNLSSTDCAAVSEGGALPWRFITREEAETACARAGKRLPKAEEWYVFSRDTAVAACNVKSGLVSKADKYPDCRSVHGVTQAVGNVWEWVSDDVIDGSWNGRVLPSSGYVAQVDSAGIATETAANSVVGSYENMYFWSQPQGAFGMLRGGFYGSRTDAGVATVHAHTAPTFAGEAIGFRCVR